jgi:hypothetical protein
LFSNGNPFMAFSQAVSQLKACKKSGQAFAEQHHITEMARLHAGNARSMLELRRAEHGSWTTP